MNEEEGPQAVVIGMTALPSNGKQRSLVTDIRHVVAALLSLVKGIYELLKDFEDFTNLEESARSRLVQEAGQKIFVWR